MNKTRMDGFTSFMDRYFPDLILLPALFYSWPIGIRFELGTHWNKGLGYEGSPYLENVYSRAIRLFEAAHAEQDELYIVTHLPDFGDLKRNRKKLVMTRYMNKKSLRYRLMHREIPYVIPEDNEEGHWKSHLFVLPCRRNEVDYPGLLKECCNEDMGFKKTVCQEVFIVNKTRKTIFHVYDDRGCDLIAASVEAIRPMYEMFNSWILDYDRLKIDQVFNGGNTMKPVMKRSELQNKEDIWNAVISAISNMDFPSGDPTADELSILFQYYSENESGGHEILLNWCSELIEEKGIDAYLEKLTLILEKIGAGEYAAIEQRYLKDIWQLYKELEQDERKEDAFLKAVQQADRAYQALGKQLENKMEVYFVDIYPKLIDIVE
ncbi:hypothetical protein BN1080_00237 [Planococcus massiliensis]|uniref:DUF3885 domain-containing protein n=1 Tax=Planococcus massiliensis TaxID=1499687 RepID=A0A098EHR6_9BACL|nr:DUF3885 domain-containing protein [Planococcus massiliensis]CEG21330.1 hypothetical protein BN1080_00237 [Planococcus massiliensis]